MTDNTQIQEAATAAFNALRSKARISYDSNTGPLLTVYAVESFLRRLAMSDYAGRMVLKGGMLMAANSVRDMTKDADLATHGVDNDEIHVQSVVTDISLLQPDPHDGIVIDPESIRTSVMQEDDEYHGVRAKLVATLGKAKIPFALDFSFGDPGAHATITLESVIDRPGIRLEAYPLTLNLAEKIVTAMQRRETSTRDRDFADVWVTSRLHLLSAPELRAMIDDVARRREQPIIALAEALEHMPDRQQPYAAMVQRMSYRHPTPELWTELLAGVIDFTDPLLADGAGALAGWNPDALRWS